MRKAQQDKINILQNDNALKDRKITDLEIQNKALLAEAKGDTKAVWKLADEFRMQRDDALQKVAHYERTISILQQFAPIGIAAPESQVDPLAPRLVAGVRSRGGTVTPVSSDNFCGVCITVSIRDLNNPDYMDIAKVENAYPGSAQRAREELPSRIEALAKRAPLPENLRGTPPKGISIEKMLIAMGEVANWWHAPEFREHDEVNYFKRLKHIFEAAIKPSVKQMTESDAYDYWIKCVKLSFAEMAKRGRGHGDQPHDPKRKHKVRPGTWKRVSLR